MQKVAAFVFGILFIISGYQTNFELYYLVREQIPKLIQTQKVEVWMFVKNHIGILLCVLPTLFAQIIKVTFCILIKWRIIIQDLYQPKVCNIILSICARIIKIQKYRNHITAKLSIMDSTNFTEFIKESDNDKNSIQEARVQYHTWRLLPDD